jgi:hypothetical protein
MGIDKDYEALIDASVEEVVELVGRPEVEVSYNEETNLWEITIEDNYSVRIFTSKIEPGVMDLRRVGDQSL